MSRRNWAASPAARAAHRQGVRFAMARPRRAVTLRLLRKDGSGILVDLLECGHSYIPCNDRRRQMTRTRRCEPCRRATLPMTAPATTTHPRREALTDDE